ncbi:MAG TPA: hypothetical protein VFL14_01370 [Xanthomonadales bacterium]|nr:hypothetical protein [Xanthomonadales bacterium]
MRNRPGVLAVLSHGAMDLASAAAFLATWLLRDRFDYDTLRTLLFWPVVFEAMLAVALFVIGLAAGLRSGAARFAWLAAFTLAYLAGAWLLGATAEMPKIWLVALWLWAVRIVPPRGEGFATRGHLAWVHQGAGWTGLLWGGGFLVTVALMLVVPAPELVNEAGERVSQTPAWIFPLAWTPYFVAEALVRAWRTVNRAK